MPNIPNQFVLSPEYFEKLRKAGSTKSTTKAAAKNMAGVAVANALASGSTDVAPLPVGTPEEILSNTSSMGDFVERAKGLRTQLIPKTPGERETAEVSTKIDATESGKEKTAQFISPEKYKELIDNIQQNNPAFIQQQQGIEDSLDLFKMHLQRPSETDITPLANYVSFLTGGKFDASGFKKPEDSTNMVLDYMANIQKQKRELSATLAEAIKSQKIGSLENLYEKILETQATAGVGQKQRPPSGLGDYRRERDLERDVNEYSKFTSGISDSYLGLKQLKEAGVDFEDPSSGLPGFGRGTYILEKIAGSNPTAIKTKLAADKLVTGYIKVVENGRISDADKKIAFEQFGITPFATELQAKVGLQNMANSIMEAAAARGGGFRNEVIEEYQKNMRTQKMPETTHLKYLSDLSTLRGTRVKTDEQKKLENISKTRELLQKSLQAPKVK